MLTQKAGIVLFVLFIFIGSASPLDKSTLVQVNLIARHGARSPTNPYPNDAYWDYWPQGFGQLTQVGMRQMSAVGQFIRQFYAGFLNQTYINDEIYVRSSNYDRTLMSAESFLAGLYPPGAAQMWTSDIAWQPIPVHTVDPELDILLDMDTPICPPYSQMKEDTYQTESWQKRNASWQEYYQRLKDYTGKTSDMNPFGVWDVYDTMYAEENEGLALPSWYTTQDEQLMTEYFIPWEFDTIFGGQRKGRLKGGPLITEIMENIHLVMNRTLNPPNRKVFFYSGHDNNIVTTMKITQTYNERYIPVASFLAVELHRVQNRYYVQMLFRNSSTQQIPYVLNITVCGGKSDCPVDEFEAAVKPFYITSDEWFAECQPQQHNNTLLTVTISISIGAVIVVFLSIMAALYICKAGVGHSPPINSRNEDTPLLKETSYPGKGR